MKGNTYNYVKWHGKEERIYKTCKQLIFHIDVNFRNKTATSYEE